MDFSLQTLSPPAQGEIEKIFFPESPSSKPLAQQRQKYMGDQMRNEELSY